MATTRLPKRTKDTRPTLTLKGDDFGPEFRQLINKAAERAGQTQSAWAAHVLREAAHRQIKGEGDPTAAPPAKDDSALREIEERRQADRKELEAKLDALAEQVKALTETQRKGFLARILGR